MKHQFFVNELTLANSKFKIIRFLFLVIFFTCGNEAFATGEVDITEPIVVPNTGGWQAWETVTLEDISLTEGEHILKIVFDTDYTNLNYVEFIDLVTEISSAKSLSRAVYPNPFGSTGFHIKNNGSFSYEIPELIGLKVERGQSSDSNLIGASLTSGTYILTISNENGVFNHKIVKQ